MITKIGFRAGDILQYLDKKPEGAIFKDICRDIEEPRDYLLMSLGWLAREGHVILTELNVPSRGPRNYQVVLRKQESA
ncbi:MAG: winged helix-turn-helix domain-containing protein [Candidatus Omnitrophota bacterium]